MLGRIFRGFADTIGSATGMLVLVMLVMALSTYSKLYHSLDEKTNYPIQVSFEDKFHKVGEVEAWIIISERFANQNRYNRSYYNCVNYTQDLHDLGQDLGFNTKMVVGCPLDNSSCHAWLKVELDFDPQDAEFKDYSLEYPDQEIIGGNND